MKSLSLSIIAAFTLIYAGCATTKNVKEIDCHNRTADHSIINIGKSEILFETNYDLSIFRISLKNETKKDAKIIVSESYFINEKNEAQKLINGSFDNNPIQDLIAPPKTSAKTVVAVANKSYWNGTTRKYIPLCGVDINSHGKIDVTMCNNLKAKLTYVLEGKKSTIDIPIKLNVSLNPKCEGYNLETGEKLQK